MGLDIWYAATPIPNETKALEENRGWRLSNELEKEKEKNITMVQHEHEGLTSGEEGLEVSYEHEIKSSKSGADRYTHGGIKQGGLLR